MKKQHIAIVLIFVSALGFGAVQYIKINEVTEELSALQENNDQLLREVATLESELGSIEAYLNRTVFSVGVSIRRIITLHYTRSDLDYPPVGIGEKKTVIYIYKDNSTLNLKLEMKQHPGLSIPLTIQRGDYSLPEYATEIDEAHPTIHFAPVIWSRNVNESGEYSIQLDEGWYTISLTGRWTQGGGTMLVGVKWEENGEITVLPIYTNLEIRVSNSDDYWAPFAVFDFKTR